MTSSASTATPTKHAFDRRVEKVVSPKSDINALILDYLTLGGYPNSAAKFSKEANLPPQQDISSMQAREEIRNYIHSGDIQTAIESLNELDPEILDEDKALHFSLLRLQLVELIRSSAAPGADISAALQFATTQLGPRAPTNPKFIEEMEKTMALFFYPKEDLDPHLATLLDPTLRREAADSVNKAILDRQFQRQETAIHQLVRMRAWVEAKARDKGCNLPERLDIGLKGEDAESQDLQGSSTDDSHDPMITT
ncbi:hypothetical protein S7711_01911 [Stachybotrys chartarum IBT 7711]|uniref:CTLH domain-containing protein n=1 Tax=Stachybotrys chartarum (strain CBS 109288 / IBT 7711) TaxID=1280523 RepID=A0A084AMT8_STACB|nr:hypothetical protein S7711_01911 [Stachybotrys chartarum IBT 7711]KFA48780.1 hypothetical protein S40293_01567 [Stachybotrys chartarum IBT 40293]KFA75606.1 hypothetical protein S40288_04459 [Stachybotrys chartarum IBT 40288]